MEKIGILGGTFNPVHIEHVRLAESAIKELNLDALFIMPTFISPHKSINPAPCEDRLNMLKIAFKDNQKIVVSDYEILNGGKSYTYLTVEHFKKQYGSQIFFICGGDMLTDFKSWRYPERILSACTLAVFDREDFYTDYDGELEYFKKTFGKEFVKLQYVGKSCSSTKTRVYASLGLSLKGQVPDGVEEYIVDNRLYSADKYTEFVKAHLPEKRLLHTANVVVKALSKAKELGLDSEKVRISAVLHDVAKYADYTKIKGFTLPDGVPEPVIHSFLGAFVAENMLGVTDEEVLDAIRYHTSGKADMTTLGKLIFVADMIEEGRTYEGVEKLRELFEKEDFEKCFVECLKEEFLHLVNKKQYIYEQTLNAFRFYVK
ncbi:MAG: nicotinate (nicotinamide) nucleotide adenylyltransferase [Clostridia bacterium]|nr:nicotinate (nicotinamide) nucleotide adenylyltransferase [Clostridia bacterium]